MAHNRRVIVDCAIYRSGVREDVTGDFSDALDAARDDSGAFMWVGLHEPTEQTFQHVNEELKLHPLAVEEALSGEHLRPRLERHGDTTFVVLKTVRFDERTSDIEVGNIMVFVADRFVVTVRQGDSTPLAETRRRLEANPPLLSAGPTAVLYGVCDEVVDRYGAVAHHVEAAIMSLEKQIFATTQSDVTEKIYELKREVLEFRAAEDPLIPILQEFAKGRVAGCEHTVEYFRDALEGLLRVDQEVDAHNELLTSVLTAHLALLSKQENQDQRRISAWGAIIMIPTMVAGIYGMNFDHMPELHWTAGYPAVLTLIASICLFLYWRFKKGGWL
ncbi:magnesium/cobalt transporter CorA [Actinomadura alba]